MIIYIIAGIVTFLFTSVLTIAGVGGGNFMGVILFAIAAKMIWNLVA